jgi:outer membrane protein TolC
MKFIIYIVALVSFVTAESQVLNLDSCKKLALSNNKKIKEAQMSIQASEELKKSAFTNYFPKVSASAIAMKSDKKILKTSMPGGNLPVYDGNPANLATTTQFAYMPSSTVELLDYVNTAAISLEQPLFVGGRIYYGNQLAELGIEFSKLNRDLVNDNVNFKTEELYWTLVSLDEKMLTLKRFELLLNNLQKDVEVSFKAGLVQKSDLLKVKLELNKLKSNELKLNNGIVLMKMAICQHIGVQYNDSIKFSTKLKAIDTPYNLMRKSTEAVEGRIEYRMLQKAVDAESLKKKLIIGEALPQVGFSISSRYLDMMDNSKQLNIFAASISIPISDWWGASHKIKEQELKINIAKNRLSENAELLNLQVNKAFKDLTVAHQQISVAEVSVNQSKEHLKVMQDNFDSGIIGTSDLLEAQALEQEASNALVDAKTTYLIKRTYYLQVSSQQF